MLCLSHWVAVKIRQGHECVCFLNYQIYSQMRGQWKPFKTPMLPIVTTLCRLAWGFPHPDLLQNEFLRKAISRKCSLNITFLISDPAVQNFTTKTFWIESAAFRVLTKTVFIIKRTKAIVLEARKVFPEVVSHVWLQLSLSSFGYEWGQAPPGAGNGKMN